ncbi:MAG: 50S ribosomal protein L25 [Dehalococcoidia bacterium]|jgi:large subunit ribosomal protein L25|nr:50S ribosomal protein L25 [Dehalococcoidia bacterium]MDW8008588.1 50S ribosomal protein L25 [Chloroflexota bacterium]
MVQARERVELKASRRQVLGKAVKRLRRQGLTPANIYGKGIQSLAIQVSTHDLWHLLRHAGRHEIVYLQVDGEEERPCFIRAVQKDPITDELLHVDFQQVSLTEKVRLEVPLHLVGEAPAVDRYGAMVLQLLDVVLVEGLPTALPPFIEVDLSRLDAPDSVIHVSDLQPPPGVTILTDPEMVVARAVVEAAPAEEEAVEEEAAPVEPEVVRSRREEEEEEEE